MFLLNWYREYLDIRSERQAKKRELEFCESCETLKMQLAMANDERKMLIEKLTTQPRTPESAEVDTSNLKAIMPSRISWAVRRQMLEAEDRAAAKALRENDAASTASSGQTLKIAEIEKELGVTNG